MNPAGGDSAIRHEFVDAGGLRFHVATCGAGDRLALFLHGFPECWYSWRHQMPLVAELGYRVWAPDLRGYGDSEKPTRIDDYAIETLMADVAALIDAAECRSVTLIAHDWGAIIAWYFAIRKLRPLERLAIMNVPHPFAAASAFRTWKQLRKSWYVFFFQLPWLPEAALGARGCRAVGEAIRGTSRHPELYRDSDLAVYRTAASQPGALRAMLNYYRAFVRGGGARRQRTLGAGIIATPTLMVWGARDVALGIETTANTADWVADLTLRILPEASHFVQQDEPEIVSQLLVAWLRGERVPEVT